jgi:hypothetical protein
MRFVAPVPVLLLLLLPAAYADQPAGTTEPSDKATLRLRGKVVSVVVRRIITGYDSPVALIDVDGEMFVGGAGTVLTLRPLDETCQPTNSAVRHYDQPVDYECGTGT